MMNALSLYVNKKLIGKYECMCLRREDVGERGGPAIVPEMKTEKKST